MHTSLNEDNSDTTQIMKEQSPEISYMQSPKNSISTSTFKPAKVEEEEEDLEGVVSFSSSQTVKKMAFMQS